MLALCVVHTPVHSRCVYTVFKDAQSRYSETSVKSYFKERLKEIKMKNSSTNDLFTCSALFNSYTRHIIYSDREVRLLKGALLY